MKSAAFDLDDLVRRRLAPGDEWAEFLDARSLSMGVYRVAAGASDEVTHQPHDRDEVYVAVSGRGRLTVAGEVVDVAPRSVIFVAAHVEHHFHDVTDDLVLLVFFAGPKC
jgi:mannose-6-phosphate isomerase-like protein (cupin superfamily)